MNRPKLRFPEFRDDGEWEVKKIEEIAKVITGSTPKTSDSENYGGTKLFVSPADISENRYIRETDKTLSEKGFSKSRIIPKNSILFVCIGSTIGKIAQNKIECTTNQQINSLIPFEKNSNDFIYSLLEKSSEFIASLSAQQAVPLINKSEFSAIKLHFPPTPQEQQKIASCLSALDKLIHASTEKLSLLKDHKKGLLQQLFPAEGETLPQLRFPEFKDDGEWVEKKIEVACEKPFSGGTPKSNNPTFYGGNIPFIRSAEINKEATELYLTEEGLKNSSAKLVKKGDVLLAMYGANSGDVAISKMDGAINQAILCLRSKTNNFFLFHYLTHKKNWITSKYLQGGQGNLSGDIIKSVELLFPKAPQEQQKIASCLSAADELITAQTQKIAQLQDHKKGMMQQLFPVLNKE